MNSINLLNNIPIISIEIDNNYIIKFINEVGKKTFPKIIGKNIFSIFSKDIEKMEVYLKKKTQHTDESEYIIVEENNRKFILFSCFCKNNSNNYILHFFNITKLINEQNLLLEKVIKKWMLKTKDKTEKLIKSNSLLKKEIKRRISIEEKLKLFATTDVLTNIYNRRSGRLFLKHRMKLSNRDKAKFIICFIDINGLKTINDTYGHNEGDELIIAISNILKSSIRESDFVFRIGGDEFIIVFINTDLHKSLILWDRIEFSINIYNTKSKKPYKISVSHGFAEYNPEHPKTIKDLITFADKEMYREKEKFYKLIQEE